MARFFVQSDKGSATPATDEQLKGFRTQIEAKGWKHIAQVDGGIVFETDGEAVGLNAITGGVSIGVPSDYPPAK